MSCLLTEDSLKKMQMCLLKIFDEVHGICVKNQIRYTMIGGTLIGALRHKGFVPWDDDIDIAMPYDDYKRFCKIVFSEKHEWLTFGLATYMQDCFLSFVKAFDSRTTFSERGRTRSKPKGVFIDIFPISYAGDTKFCAVREMQKHHFWRDILTRKDYIYGRGAFRCVEWVYVMLGKIFSVKYVMKKIEDHYERLNVNPKIYVSDMDGNTKGIVPSYLFDEFTLYDFEGRKFYGMKNADEYLRLVFGDYMQLPPENKRVPHHIEYIDLNKSYLDQIID